MTIPATDPTRAPVQIRRTGSPSRAAGVPDRNSILKFLGYAKEGKKADAVAKIGAVKGQAKSFAEKV